MGGNSWRMAHNPPCPTRLDFMDRLGMLAIDENRDYGGQQGQGGSTPESVDMELADMADLVRRDRSHPSVMVWSFCNEAGCKNESAAAAFRAVSKLWDPTRAVTQNDNGNYNISGRFLDVQGFSHRSIIDFQVLLPRGVKRMIACVGWASARVSARMPVLGPVSACVCVCVVYARASPGGGWRVVG